VLPAILHGESPLLVAVVGASAIMFAATYLTQGVARERGERDGRCHGAAESGHWSGPYLPPTAHGSARCGPTWCRVISLDADGTAIELMRTDGAQRERIGDATMAAPLTDPTPLDRFEILAQIGDNTALTNHVQLVGYEISTRRLVLISPDAFDVNFRAGVLWWSTGTDDAFVRHALDLRTV
jgi:hypothetical protein